MFLKNDAFPGRIRWTLAALGILFLLASMSQFGCQCPHSETNSSGKNALRVCVVKIGTVLDGFDRQKHREEIIAAGHLSRQALSESLEQFARHETELLQLATADSFKEIGLAARSFAQKEGWEIIARLPEEGSWRDDHLLDFDVIYWKDGVDRTQEFLDYLNKEFPENGK